MFIIHINLAVYPKYSCFFLLVPDLLPVPASGSMGIWISRLLSLFGDQEARILVLGLDNAGKTTILCAYDTLSQLSRAFPPLEALLLTFYVSFLSQTGFK